MDRFEGRLIYEFDAYHLDTAQRLLRLKADGRALPLNSRAFETLLYFVEHSGELLDKARLMKALWPDTVVEENNLTQHIAALRRVLGESPEQHRFIVTVPGRGYRFVAGVRILTPDSVQPPEADGTAAGLATAAPPASVEAPLEARIGKSSPTVAPWVLASAALGLLVGAFLLWFVARPTADSTPVAAAPTSVTWNVPSRTVGKLRVAILPFENLSPDPAHAFFADGLHEEILSTIAQRVPSLEVISRTTMMSYRRDRPMRLAEMARELGASHLIEGSVRREAKSVRLTLQLIDARTDAHVWSQNYDRTLTDSLTLQSEVAGEVASQLSVQLVRGAQPDGPLTRSPEAYDLYLKALASGLLSPFAPVEHYRGIQNQFSRAIALDPAFALAYARLAAGRMAAFAFNYDVSEEQVRRIREDLNAAQRLAPRDPLVLAVESMYWMWVERDPSRALAVYESAEAAGLADPYFIARKTPMLVHLRRVDEAVRYNERMMDLDPGNPFVLSVSAVTLAIANRPAEALRVVDRGLERSAEDVALQLVRAQVIFAFTGRADEWRAVIVRIGKTTSPATLLAEHFVLLRTAHRYAELQTLLDGISTPTIRVISGPGGGAFVGVGQRPTAEYRGWTALLLEDSATAAVHGRTVLEFVAHQKETKTNAWFLQLLAAEGFLFLGQRERAIASARKTLESMPPSRDAQSWVSAARVAAGVYAWSGAHDAAVALLEELFTPQAGLGGPASITRDPLYAVPLAQNPRYQALAGRVEAQMRATKLR